MLVIHPHDRTTAFLSLLYEGTDFRALDQSASSKAIQHALHHTPQSERIMLLGHGSEEGLFSREDDTAPDFDRIIVGHPHAHNLRRHGGNIIGIWCNAVDFARRKGLHGLFSGMIISDINEAQQYGIITLQQHIDEANERLCTRLRALLDQECPLHEIPALMRRYMCGGDLVDQFNYEKFVYL